MDRTPGPRSALKQRHWVGSGSLILGSEEGRAKKMEREPWGSGEMRRRPSEDEFVNFGFKLSVTLLSIELVLC